MRLATVKNSTSDFNGRLVTVYGKPDRITQVYYVVFADDGEDMCFAKDQLVFAPKRRKTR